MNFDNEVRKCMMLVLIFLAINVLLLTGCASNKTKVEVSQHVGLECGAEPQVDRLHMRKVEPWVIEDNAGITWIGISPDHYENLGTNIADIKKQLKQRVAVNAFYRDCIEDFNVTGVQEQPPNTGD